MQRNVGACNTDSSGGQFLWCHTVWPYTPSLPPPPPPPPTPREGSCEGSWESWEGPEDSWEGSWESWEGPGAHCCAHTLPKCMTEA